MGREHLGDEGGEIMIRIYHMKINLFSIKIKRQKVGLWRQDISSQPLDTRKVP